MPTERDFAEMIRKIGALAEGRGRGAMRAKRAAMMPGWADFLDQTLRGENVLKFRAA